MKLSVRAGLIPPAVALVMCLCVQAEAAKNVILMIGDGMGREHVMAGSCFATGRINGLPFQGYSRCRVTTRSLNAEVTDSAASATTMATGHKTNNGMLSQSPEGKEYQTILEYAKAMGKKTGLVTTVPITHATPAAFGAHEPSRNNYVNIGNDYLGSSRPDVIFGGGDPTKAGGSAFFTTEQVARARELGYRVVRDVTGLNSLRPGRDKRALGLFAGVDVTLECQRRLNCTEPHLSEMAAKALSLLEGDPDGLFLMIEGGSIDHAAHGLNIDGVTWDVAEFGRTSAVVLKWMEKHPDTLLILTADHETGGLTMTPRAKGQVPSAKWSTQGSHTGTNVPLYAAGKDLDLLRRYIKNFVMDDTDVYRMMKAAMDRGIGATSPPPGK